MSSTGIKIAIFPTRMALNNMQNRLKGAKTGHTLLKRKSEALSKKFRLIIKKIYELKLSIGKVMQQASFSYAEVVYSAGDIRFILILIDIYY